MLALPTLHAALNKILRSTLISGRIATIPGELTAMLELPFELLGVLAHGAGAPLRPCRQGPAIFCRSHRWQRRQGNERRESFRHQLSGHSRHSPFACHAPVMVQKFAALYPRVPARGYRIHASPLPLFGNDIERCGRISRCAFESRRAPPYSAACRTWRAVTLRMVTSSSAAVGCSASAASKSALVAFIFTAIATAWMISAAASPTM